MTDAAIADSLSDNCKAFSTILRFNKEINKEERKPYVKWVVEEDNRYNKMIHTLAQLNNESILNIKKISLIDRVTMQNLTLDKKTSKSLPMNGHGRQ